MRITLPAQPKTPPRELRPNDEVLTAWLDVLATHERVALTGGPRSGKTTLSRAARYHHVVHTDDWKDSPWAEQPAEILLALEALRARRTPFVIEGVQVPRLLRRGLHVDAVVTLDTHPLGGFEPNRHERMRKAVFSVLREWSHTLNALSVKVYTLPSWERL